jgi:hypothetical protein
VGGWVGRSGREQREFGTAIDLWLLTSVRREGERVLKREENVSDLPKLQDATLVSLSFKAGATCIIGAWVLLQ